MQLVSRLRRSGSLLVMAGFVLSRVTGLLRDMLIYARFGTSAELGAYQAAFRITDFLYIVIIGGALGSSFIPLFIQVWEHDGRERAWELTSAVVTWALAILAVASGILWLLAPLLTNWLYGGQGFSPETLALTSRLTRLFLFSPLLLGLGGLAMAALNARDRFTLPALAPVAYNVGIIGGALLAPWFGIWGLAWGVVVGALFNVLIQLPGLWQLGMRLRLGFRREMREVGTIARQMAPRVLGQSAAQISALITAVLTARVALGEERMAGVNLAFQLMLLPYGVFSLSLSTVAFPRLARLYADGQHAEMTANIRRTLGLILTLTIPAAVALVVLRVPIVRLLFQRGAFDMTSLRYTIGPLIGYATALPAFAASEILIRAFYAMQETRIPVLVGIGQVTLNLIFSVIALQSGAGVEGLTLAFSIANNLESIVLFVLLQQRLPSLWQAQSLGRTVTRAAVASLVLGGILWLVREQSRQFFPYLGVEGAYLWTHDLLPLMLWLGVVGMVGAGGYWVGGMKR